MVERSSRTAEYNALFRALEHLRPARSRLFTDPLAENFLPPSLRTATKVARLPGGKLLVTGFIDRRWPGPRASSVARTRMIDDALRESMANGTDQVILLGVGFDSRSFRIDGINACVVFEVDREATLETRRARLSRVAEVPPHVHLVPVDFEQDDLASALIGKGLRHDRPVAVIWEGVTNYLTAQAAHRTLRILAGMLAPGSRLIFTYVDQRALSDDGDFPEAQRWRAAVSRVGEPFRFGLTPEELADFLTTRGWTMLSDRSTAEGGRRLFAELGRHDRASGLYRVVVADRRDG